MCPLLLSGESPVLGVESKKRPRRTGYVEATGAPGTRATYQWSDTRQGLTPYTTEC